MISSSRNCLKFLPALQPGLLLPNAPAALLQLQQVRQRQTKHWNPKFKRLRGQKFVKVDLPNFQEKPSELSPDELRSRLKERGLLPPRPWLERPFHISCTGGIFEAYVPPEGDGKKSFISATGAKQKFEFLEKKSKSMLAVRKIRAYEEDFETNTFCEQAQDIYKTAHTLMSAKDKYKLREYITERCYPEMMHNVKDKTIRWSFLKSLEPPRLVHARVTDVITKENLFAQVTVRFHTQQTLAIYDRFGRLMHGSEIIAKDVLEYVVFEKHISNEYGQWRMHDKIIPDWLPPREPAPITYHLVEEPEETAAIEAGQQQQQQQKPEDAKQLKASEIFSQAALPEATATESKTKTAAGAAI